MAIRVGQSLPIWDQETIGSPYAAFTLAHAAVLITYAQLLRACSDQSGEQDRSKNWTKLGNNGRHLVGDIQGTQGKATSAAISIAGVMPATQSACHLATHRLYRLTKKDHAFSFSVAVPPTSSPCDDRGGGSEPEASGDGGGVERRGREA